MVNPMIRRINTVTPLPDFLLSVHFDDGKKVIYDVKEDMRLPGYQNCGTCADCFSRFSLTRAERAFSGTKILTCRAISFINMAMMFQKNSL